MRLFIPLTSSASYMVTVYVLPSITHLFSFFTNSVIMVWRFLHVSKSTIVSSNIAHNLAMSQGIAYQRRQSKILRITCRQNKTLYHQQLQRNVIISEFLFMFCTFTQGIQLDKNAIPR